MIKIFNKQLKIKSMIAILFLLVYSNISNNLITFADTTPDVFIYEGKLLDNMGDVIANPHTFRFSLWKDDDLIAGDVNGAGAINVAALNYSGWQEEQVLIPNSTGSFSFKLGDNVAIPDIDFALHKYLQVEIKAQGDPDINYELMDPTGDNGADIRDRQTIGSSLYAKNSEKLDNHEIGLIQGDVALVGPNDQWLPQLIPDAIFPNTFTLDFDNTIQGAGTGSIDLVFGDTLGKKLSYDTDNDYFNFNDDVNIQGDLTVIGTINGVVLGIVNRSLAFEPEYSDSVMFKDGTSNKGKLEVFFEDTDGAPGNENYNYYQWSTKQAAIQDIDLIIRTYLPEGFDHWQAVPIQFTYKTSNAVLANNKIDITIEDSNGNPVVLNNATNLASAAWATTDVTFVGAPVWTAGDFITIKIKLSADQIGEALAGKIMFNYVGS